MRPVVPISLPAAAMLVLVWAVVVVAVWAVAIFVLAAVALVASVFMLVRGLRLGREERAEARRWQVYRSGQNWLH